MGLLSKIGKNKEIIKNRTYKYLMPPLGYYGGKFIAKIKSLKILAFAIGDRDLDNSFIKDRECIYILYDEAYRPRITKGILDWLYNQDYFIEETYFTDHNSSLRYLIIEFPFERAIKNFVRGKYSCMYSKEDVEIYFSKNNSTEAYKVFTKDREMVEKHIKRVNDLYKTNVSSSEIDLEKFECDFKPDLRDEVFNLEN